MKLLYVGHNKERFHCLKRLMISSRLPVEHTALPEQAFFHILHDSIQALFLDLSEPFIDGLDTLQNAFSLNKDLEVILIGDPKQLNALPQDVLEKCFGYLLSDMEQPVNNMIFSQLVKKIASKAIITKLRSSSELDGLTKLHNHAFIQQHIEEEIALLRSQKAPLSLVIMDIDNFKNYNDTNGHPAGDRLLRKLAEMMRNSFRQIDLKGRYGGEEFVVLLPSTSLENALNITERFRKTLTSTQFEHGEKQPLGFVSASFGVAFVDYDKINDKTTLLKLADQALYKAKEDTRNCIWYNSKGRFHRFTPR